MGTPRDMDARRFYLAGGRRKDDGRNLFTHDDSIRGAVYISGYSVECMLKALIIVQAGKNKDDVIAEFRGGGAHNFDRLRDLFRKQGGSFPRQVTEAFLRVRDWSTDWRYDPSPYAYRDAENFLKAVEIIYNWADGRL
jgi:hypothetical protein